MFRINFDQTQYTVGYKQTFLVQIEVFLHGGYRNMTYHRCYTKKAIPDPWREVHSSAF